jgi:cation transport ATPase
MAGKIKQNRAYASLCNAALIAVAASGLLCPALAGLATAVGPVSGTASSLALKRRRPSGAR